MSVLEPNRKAGEVLVITAGEYSDYCITGVFRVVQDFNLDTFTEKASRKTAPSGYSWWCEEKININEMTKAGVIEDFDFTEVHSGRY